MVSVEDVQQVLDENNAYPLLRQVDVLICGDIGGGVHMVEF